MRILPLLLALIIIPVSVQAQVAISEEKPKIELGMFFDRVCMDGTCDLTIYSSPKRVYENGMWMEAINVSRIGNKWIIYTEVDMKTYINVTWCYDEVCNVCLRVDESMESVMIPYYKDGKESVRMIFTPNSNYCQITNATRLKFGEDSTTITLSTADTENMDDTYVTSASTGNEFGAAAIMRTKNWTGQATQQFEAFMRWNITSIPAGQRIDSALLSLFLDANALDDGEAYNYTARHVLPHPTYNISGLPWVEGDGNNVLATTPELNWSEKPAAGEYNSTAVAAGTITNSSAASAYYNFTITPIVGEAYQDGESNVSIWLQPDIGAGSPGNDVVDFSTKEVGGTSEDPILYITYSAVGPVDNPPTTTLVSPTDASTDTDGQVTFNCTATDDNDVANISVWNNASGTWALNWTNATSGTWAQAGNNLNFTNATTILWNCIATDNASQTDWGAANWTVFINIPGGDVTPPDIVFVAPSPDNETVTVNYTYINLTISEAGYCLLDWNGTNESMANTTQAETYFVNKTGLTNGNYTFMAWCNDTTGNLNNSETRWVYINWTEPDTEPPDVNWVEPVANGTEAAEQTYIFWNISSTEAIGIGFIEINGSNNTCTSVNTTIASCSYNQTGLTGNNTWCAFGYAHDAAGNSNRTTTMICRTTNISAAAAPALEAEDVFYAFDHLLNYIFLIGSEIMDAWYAGTVYGEMWNYSANVSAWTFPIALEDTYYNLTNLTNGDLRGVTFTHESQVNGGSYLTVSEAGIYKIDATFSAQGVGNNQLYSFGIARNHDIDNSRECYVRRFISLQSAIGSAGITCLVEMNADDTLVAVVENEASSNDIEIHAVNVNIIKVGET